MFEKLKEGHRDWNMQVSKRLQKALGEVKRQPGKKSIKTHATMFLFSPNYNRSHLGMQFRKHFGVRQVKKSQV